MAAHRKRETFAPVDAAWLRMDQPTNLMMITGVVTFDRPLDVRRLKETVERRLLRHDRFRQRVRASRGPLGLPSWEDDPHFNINAHIHRIALPEPGDAVALQELVSDLMSTPLDFSKPLWQFHLVEKYGSGSALIVRLHHCIADGLALVQVLLAMADRVRDSPVEPATESEAPRAGLLDALLRPATTAISQVMHGAEAVLHEGWETLLDPAHALTLARQGADGAAALGKLVLTLPDRKTILRGPCGVPKRAVWSEPVLLSEVKTIGHSLGATVNDVLLAAVAGALRRYLAARGQPIDGVDIRAMIPVNLRRPDELDKLGNRFGLVILSLPVGVEGQRPRVAAVKKRMDDIKHTPEAAMAFGILNALGLTPVDVEKLIMDFFATKVSAVLTNVPGPREPLYLAGGRLESLMFWVPVAANLALGISILSYAGNVLVGFATDAGLIPDPETLLAGFHAELAEMRAMMTAPTAAAPPAGRCQARTRSGQPCKNRAAAGATTCRVHAGR